MKQIILVIASLLMSASGARGQEVLELSTGNLLAADALQAPAKNVTSGLNETTVTYEIKTVSLREDRDSEGVWRFGLEGFGENTTPGQPAYLMNADRFYVPDGHRATLLINECEYRVFDYRLAPAHIPEYYIPDDEKDQNPGKAVVRPFEGFCPQTFAALGETESYRGLHIQDVNIMPVQYNYAEGKVRILTRLSYTVSMVGDDSASRKLPAGIRMNVYDDALVNNNSLNILNSNLLGLAKDRIIGQSHPKEYLIITTPRFETEVKRFAQWKGMMGLKTQIMARSNWTIEGVRQIIRTFANSHPDLYYLLIVGDFEDVPARTGKIAGNNLPHVSDYEYACIDGDDFPDVLMGRIPVSTPAEARIVFDKIIQYEKNPPASDRFYNNAAHAAYFETDDRSTAFRESNGGFIQSSEEARDIMTGTGKTAERIYYAMTSARPMYFKNGTLLPKELMYENYPWDGNASQIIQAINRGVFYVLHRDHGLETCWNHPSFTCDDIDKLANGNLLPVAFSINCLTGKFDTPVCMAEKFLRHKDGGAVAVIAAGAETSPFIGTCLTKEIFSLIANSPRNGCGDYEGSTCRLGEILTISFANLVGSGKITSSNHDRKMFHCFGDPSMVFLTSAPSSPENVTIKRDNGTLTVSTETPGIEIVTYNSESGALVVYNQSSVNIKTDSNLSVCIKGKGMRPVIYMANSDGTLKIQNETLGASREYTVDKIKIGSDIDDTTLPGTVSFTKGLYRLNGTVDISGEVEIDKGVEFSISPK